MKLFGGTTEQEKAISTLIHDHCNAAALMGSYINLAKRILNGSVGEQELNDVLKYLDGAKEGIKKATDVLDIYCEKAKNDFNN